MRTDERFILTEQGLAQYGGVCYLTGPFVTKLYRLPSGAYLPQDVARISRMALARQGMRILRGLEQSVDEAYQGVAATPKNY